MIRVSAILLAAGLSRRMGDDKLLLMYRNKTLLQCAVELLSELPVFERIIVTSKEKSADITQTSCTRLIVNPYPEKGQSGSIRLGVEAAAGTHFLFLTADQPGLCPDDVIPFLEKAKSNPGMIIFPVIDGKPNSPAIFPDSFRQELLSLSGDTGGRTIRDANPEACLSFVPKRPECFLDVDSKHDYEKILDRL